jgi:hypothetical protein
MEKLDKVEEKWNEKLFGVKVDREDDRCCRHGGG